MGNGKDADLSPIKLVYETLNGMNGDATPEGMAEVTGLSLELVEQAIEKLEELRLIETTNAEELRYTTATV